MAPFKEEKPLNELIRSEYLEKPVIQAFCRYLRGLFDGDLFDHRFEVKWRRWAKYLLDPDNPRKHQWHVEEGERTTGSDSRRAIPVLHFTSVKSAYDAYYWPTNSLVTAADDDGDDESEEETDDATVAFDRESNEKRLAPLRKSLTDALQEASAQNTFIVAMKILDWGQVYKGSVGWLIQKHEHQDLIRAIRDAVHVLDGDQLSGTTAFQGQQDLRMDSGLTKVYSLASHHSIIYDDRVGAAMGLIVARFLQTNPDYQRPGQKDKVPEELQFMRGLASTRNPSRPAEGIKFPGKKGGALHAQSNLIANWILHKIADAPYSLWGKADMTEKLRAMESALFMLGYRVW